jgi:negative regulator of sigma E activity
MKCQRVRTYLSAYCEETLPSDKAHELEAHIRNCKRCEQEKQFLEQILAAAKSLPQTTLPEDFNLQLMNRIYSEQGVPRESYLEAEPLPFWRRPVRWVSAVATVAVCTLATVFVIDQLQSPTNVQQAVPGYSTAVPAPSEVRPVVAKRQLNPNEMRAYEDMIGVSGPASSYRSTNLEALHAFRINQAQIESLYVETQRKMGKPVIPAKYRMNLQNAGIRTMDGNRQERRFQYQQAAQKQ